jgi:hypothetical protein
LKTTDKEASRKTILLKKANNLNVNLLAFRNVVLQGLEKCNKIKSNENDLQYYIGTISM